MTDQSNQRPTAIRMVLPFVFRHWRNQPAASAVVTGGFIGATVSDLFMPLFAGQLVDAITLGATDPSRAPRAHSRVRRDHRARPAADPAPPVRAVGDRAVHAARPCRHGRATRSTCVQRFSTDWHANSFAGSTVRKITRGMWAVDLLNDTILLALLPSLVVLSARRSCSACTGRSLGAGDRRSARSPTFAMTVLFDELHRAGGAAVERVGHARSAARWPTR